MKPLMTLILFALMCSPTSARQEPFEGGGKLSPELKAGVRLEADGKVIDIGILSSHAHAGPTLGDVDGDGDRDLVVGDFPGYFWFFENVGTESRPEYKGRGKLMAGDEAAKTPVY